MLYSELIAKRAAIREAGGDPDAGPRSPRDNSPRAVRLRQLCDGLLNGSVTLSQALENLNK